MNEHVSVPSPVGEDYLLLGQYAERAYLEYAMSVVRGRALPEVSDGLSIEYIGLIYIFRYLLICAALLSSNFKTPASA